MELTFYKTLLNKNGLFTFYPFIYHLVVNANYCKIIIIKIFKMCRLSKPMK